MYTLVQSESSDWFIIPADKLGQWYDEDMFEDDIEYATYISDASSIRFDNFTEA